LLTVKDRGSRPKTGRKIRIDGERNVVSVTRAVIESGRAFQRVVSHNINDPITYLCANASGVAQATIRARAIENVVPIAVPEGAGYRIYNPTRYRQCSSYVDDRFGLVDEKRQTAGSVFKRIPEIAYRKLLQ